jgi:hypothetical protein
VTDFLDDKREEITNRLKDLKPLVDEYGRLEAAASALARAGASTSASATVRRRGPGRPRGSVNRASKAVPAATPARAARKKPGRPKGRVGRRKGSGARAAQALSVVRGQPGITIPELAAKMGIKHNYLYRVLPGLEQDGKVEKKGRGWHPKAA